MTQHGQYGLQGYLAHEKKPTPLGPPYDPRCSPTVGSWEGGVFDGADRPTGLDQLGRVHAKGAQPLDHPFQHSVSQRFRVNQGKSTYVGNLLIYDGWTMVGGSQGGTNT